jgi:hypothetical protein
MCYVLCAMWPGLTNQKAYAKMALLFLRQLADSQDIGF